MTGAAAVGVAATAYLTGRASWKAALAVREYEDDCGAADTKKKRFEERAKLVWKLYIPPVVSGAATVGFLVGANRVELKKTLAAQTAFVASQQLYSDYRAKVVQELGEKKDTMIRESVAADKVAVNPPPMTLIAGTGDVLCCELHTMRYFICDIEKLRQAMNQVNHRINNHDYVTLTWFYELIGLQRTSSSDDLGWRADMRLMELEMTSALTEDNRPCLAFDYNYITNV